MADRLDDRLRTHYAAIEVDEAIEHRLAAFARELGDRPGHRLRTAVSITAAAAVVVGLAVGIPLATSSHEPSTAARSANPTRRADPSTRVTLPPTPAPEFVPRPFRAACGNPGAHVVVHTHQVTVQHSACDLTGVVISYRNVREHYAIGGAVVPARPGGVGNSMGLSVTVESGTLDVTVTVRHGRPGNA